MSETPDMVITDTVIDTSNTSIMYRLVPVESGSIEKPISASENRIEACKANLTSKKNPRTGNNYTPEEAGNICAAVGNKAYGKDRFQKLASRGKASSSAVSAVGELDNQFMFIDEGTEHTDENQNKYWRYLFRVADATTKARGTDGSIKTYNAESHKKCAERFIGRNLVINHDGDLEGGIIFDSWAEDNGDLKQVIHVYSEDFKSMIDKGYRLSIKTIPLDIEGTTIRDYEALHTSLLFPGDVPGCDASGVIEQLESKVEENKGETKVTETKTFTQAEIDAIVSSKVAEVKEAVAKQYAEEMKVSTLKSSISAEFGTSGDALDKIVGGGIVALEAYKSAISDITEKAKQTVISQKSVQDAPETPKEKTATVVSKVANMAEDLPSEHVLEITPEQDAASTGLLKRIGVIRE